MPVNAQMEYDHGGITLKNRVYQCRLGTVSPVEKELVAHLEQMKQAGRGAGNLRRFAIAGFMLMMRRPFTEALDHVLVGDPEVERLLARHARRAKQQDWDGHRGNEAASGDAPHE